MNNEERLVGVRSAAAPVHDQTGYGIASAVVQGPTVRLGDDRMDDLVGAVAVTARELSSLHRTSGGG
ncbi:hypothetical protein E1161_12935 [Saccharopolyspora aridisoli]|uniref:IclR-ED domain-containing protein n=1 Tax=Saccharopolyspora aridisoli TaxID=2530385 RepID=A0A4R4V0H2_9PSEU|nr:hypothetical protein E1161_12935 [Saccharopolyspora aridisoli]